MTIPNSEETPDKYTNVVGIQCVIGNWIDGGLHDEDKFFDEHDKEQYDKYLKGRKEWELDCFLLSEGELRITGGRTTRYHFRNPYNIKIPKARNDVSFSIGGDYWAFTMKPLSGDIWKCKWDKEEEKEWQGKFLKCKVSKKDR